MVKYNSLRRRLFAIALVLWTSVIGLSLVRGWHDAQRQAMDSAYAEARANLNKDITFRRWGTLHGGVYVPITETQKSIPWLSHVPDRDVVTRDGLALTLLNPASMLRQMMDLYAADYGVRGRITGLRQLNPDNAPDAWERAQLERFVRGEAKEVWAVSQVEGQPHLRHLRAMYMEPGCDKCHAILGYQTGDMRGATGLNLPLAPYLARIADSHLRLIEGHLLIWGVGLAGIFWGNWLAIGWGREREQIQADQERHRSELESLVAERTAELAESTRAAEMANQAKSAFLANMSHEIRTPLNAITGVAHLIRRNGLAPGQSEQLDRIDTAGRHLLEVVNAVLDLAKIESGQIVLAEKPFSLRCVLGNVLSMQNLGAASKHLRLNVEVDADVPDTWVGDAARLQQGLLNYVGNAVKFTDAGSIVLRAGLIGETPVGAMLRFEVEDSGVGIAADDLASLFSEFRQVDPAVPLHVGGTGLGLVITRKIARLMGGDAGASSIPGRGSLFWLTVCLKPGASVLRRGTVASGQDAERGLRETCAGKRILLVEDDPINQEIARSLMADFGLLVDTAGDGQQALAAVADVPYDLVLMDMQMPIMDGLQATRAMRARPGLASLPIIAMTANAFDDDRLRCTEAGMNDFIAKPVEPELFFDTIYRWLQPATADQFGRTSSPPV